MKRTALSALVISLAWGILSASGPKSSLVEIKTYGKHSTEGSGFFVDTGGIVATAIHVITGSEPDDFPDSVIVITSQGKRLRAKEVIGFNIDMDVCLLRVDYRNKDYIIPLETSLTPGDSVLIISKGRKDIRALFTRFVSIEPKSKWGYLTLPVKPGYSGSPVLNQKSRAIGITAMTNTFTPSSYIAPLTKGTYSYTIREVHSIYAKTPQAFFEFAQSQTRFKNDTSKAIAYLRQATSMKPNLAEAHFNLWLLLADQGRYKEARAELERAAELYEKQGNYEMADEIWTFLKGLPKD